MEFLIPYLEYGILKNKHTKGMYNRILNTIAIVWYLKKYLYVKLIYCFLSDQII